MNSTPCPSRRACSVDLVVDDEVDEHALRLSGLALGLAVAIDEQVRAADGKSAIAHLGHVGQANRVAVEALEAVGVLAGDLDVEAVDLHLSVLS